MRFVDRAKDRDSSTAASASRRSWHFAMLFFAIAWLAVAAGCRTHFAEYVHNGFKVGPNYEKPCAAVSEHWIDYKDPRVISSPPRSWAWWRVFNDPVLDNLVQTAHNRNLTLREAGLRVMEARAIRNIAVGTWFPQLQQAFGSYQRQQVSLQNPVGGGGIPGVPRAFDVWTTGGQLAWELDFWGKFRRAIEAADAELDASVEDYDDVLVILLSDVAEAYVDFRTAEQRIAYARANVRSQNGSLEITTSKKEEGVASQLDVAQAKTNVAQTEALIPQFEIRQRAAQNRLCVLMGMPPADISQILAQTRGIPRAPTEVALGIPADLLRRRPDVRRAERLAAAQSARIGIAESEMYPAFTINGQLFVQADKVSNLFTTPAVGGNIGPSFTWNLLNYGRLLNRVNVEDARFLQRVTNYQNTVLTANREAEDALIAFLRAQEQARVLREGVAAAEESRNLVNDLYRGGRADFGRVFFAEYFLVQQQDSLAIAEGAISAALVALYRAIGGGWEIRLESLPPMQAVPPPPPEDVPPGTPAITPIPPTPGAPPLPPPTNSNPLSRPIPLPPPVRTNPAGPAQLTPVPNVAPQVPAAPRTIPANP